MSSQSFDLFGAIQLFLAMTTVEFNHLIFSAVQICLVNDIEFRGKMLRELMPKLSLPERPHVDELQLRSIEHRSKPRV